MIVRVRVDCGVDCARVPVKAKVEYEVQNRMLTLDTLFFDILYKRKLLEKRYPQLDVSEVEMSTPRSPQDRRGASDEQAETEVSGSSLVNFIALHRDGNLIPKVARAIISGGTYHGVRK
jgi:hypothetical protein